MAFWFEFDLHTTQSMYFSYLIKVNLKKDQFGDANHLFLLYGLDESAKCSLFHFPQKITHIDKDILDILNKLVWYIYGVFKL